VPPDADLTTVTAGGHRRRTDRCRAGASPSELSVDHGLGFAEPKVTGLQPFGRCSSFHPNLAGMQAVADELHRYLVG
jgi:hypothetical protein